MFSNYENVLFEMKNFKWIINVSQIVPKGTIGTRPQLSYTPISASSCTAIVPFCIVMLILVALLH